jgi:hypothetical protein
MIYNQAYIDAKQTIRDHEKTCAYCKEWDYFNYFQCPTWTALKQAESDSITQEQIDENAAIVEELEEETKLAKAEARLQKNRRRSLFDIIIPLGMTKRESNRTRHPRITFANLSSTPTRKTLPPKPTGKTN